MNTSNNSENIPIPSHKVRNQKQSASSNNEWHEKEIMSGDYLSMEVTSCLTDECDSCTGSYSNSVFRHRLICAYPREPSNDFLGFAENRFSGNKADPKHNPSFRSYLLRIPYTLNSKCLSNGTDPEIKIIRKFDPDNIPKLSLQLLREFRLYLADRDIKNKAKTKVFKKKQKLSTFKGTQQMLTGYVPQCYQWIENKLLEKAIPDHRKYTIDLLLAPFFTNIRHLSYNETYSMIDGWILRCNSVNRLRPSLVYFEDKIKNAINSSIQKGILPIKQQTMEARYPGWFSDFRKWHLFDDIF